MSATQRAHDPRGRHARTVARRLVAISMISIAAIVAGCSADEPTMKGCVVVDISDSARREMTSQYLPGLDAFVSRMAEQGTGDVCFGYAARGLLGGPAARAQFACSNPKDELDCKKQIRDQVVAAATQLANQAARVPEDMHGFSELIEALGILAPNTRAGDEILLLTDGIQKSADFGNFYSRHLELDATGRQRLLDYIEEVGLLPDLAGRRLRIPYLLTHTKPGPHDRDMSAIRRQEIRAFWTEYAERTNAEIQLADGVNGA